MKYSLLTVGPLCVVSLLVLLCTFGCSWSSHKSVRSLIMASMVDLQIAVEAYSRKHKGIYPTEIDSEVITYLPKFHNGSNEAYVNPCSPGASWFYASTVLSKKELFIKANKGVPGQVIYCPLEEKADHGYWILAKDETGTFLSSYDQNGKSGIFALIPAGHELLSFEGIPTGAPLR